MADLTTFSNNEDLVRFEKRMQSTRASGSKSLYLSAKGIPKFPYYEEFINATDRYVSSGNNVNGKLWSTYAGATPAISFVGNWESASSQVLTYFELDNEAWLDNSALV